MTSPDVSKILAELDRCPLKDSGDSSLAAVDEIRFCNPDGRSPDGKKRNQPGKPAFPWDGASDSQPLLADGIINERTALLISAFWRAAVKAKAGDDEASQFAVRLVGHYLNEALVTRMFQEVALSANHLEHYGVVVLHPCWEREVTLRRVKVTLEEVLTIAQKAHESEPQIGLENTQAYLMDPTQEDNAVAVIQYLYSKVVTTKSGENSPPDLKVSAARKLVRALREKGEGELPVPVVSREEPAVYALRVRDEIWIPTDTTDLQEARIIFQRVWMTEASLLAKAAEGWNPQWIEEAIKTKGQSLDNGVTLMGSSPRSASGSVLAADGATPKTDLIEVLYATYRAVDEDGVPGIYQTILSKHVPQPKGEDRKGGGLYAKSELISYSHGRYPYIGGRAEHWSRQFLASRGVPEVVRSWQNEAKAMDDSFVDFLSMAVLPPVNIPPGPGGKDYKFGPAVKNTVQPGREPQFMQIPVSGAPYALNGRERLEKRVNNHFGLMSADVPAPRWQQTQALKATSFLLLWSAALQQMVSLAQQYLPDAEFARITGAPVGWLDQRRDRFGLMAITLSFDVRDLDSELTLKKIEIVNKAILPADAAGVIDRTKWTEMQLRAVDPVWARDLVMPAAAASEQLWNQVRNDIAQMALGNEAKYVENDPTAATKLQYADQIVKANPQYQGQLAQPGRFSELMQKYVANLQFSMQQQQNRQIGRIGVQPEAPQ